MNISPVDVNRYAWGAWLLSWLAAAAWSSPSERRPSVWREQVYRLLIYRLLIAIGAILLFLLHDRWPSIDVELWRAGGAVAWMLVAITLLGFAFTWWARIALGRLWSSGVARKAHHTIVDSGPYRLVRHPIYSGIMLAVLATAAMRGTVGGCIGAAAIVIGLFVKARLEENFLRSELGEAQYGAYARRVPMLVPFRRVSGPVLR